MSFGPRVGPIWQDGEGYVEVKCEVINSVTRYFTIETLEVGRQCCTSGGS